MNHTALDTLTAELIHRSIHDLAGPANRIRALAQLLLRNLAENDSDSQKLLGYISDSAADVAIVADGLKKYVQICTRPFERRPLDLNLPLQSAVTNLAPEIESRGGQLTHSALPVVEADGYLMSCVFHELLSNALRFGRQTGWEVCVSAARLPEGDAVVSIADNGPGIERDMAQKIFRPFEKLAGKSAGMGLAICRKIVEMHGGRIWLEDRTPGAEFRFSIDGNSAA
jgi:signal transduction histidine kinase